VALPDWLVASQRLTGGTWSTVSSLGQLSMFERAWARPSRPDIGPGLGRASADMCEVLGWPRGLAGLLTGLGQ
jgi:hypothetical protein